MIVRLTHSQQTALRRRLPDLFADAMAEHRVAYGPRQHEVTLPAVAWRRIVEILRDQAYGPLGGVLAGSASLYRGISRVQQQVNRVDTHPAFSGVAVLGAANEVIPAWRLLDGTFTPYPPTAYGEFGLLAPVTEELQGRSVTMWRWRPDWLQPENLLHQEVFHRHFSVGGHGERVPQFDGG